MGLAQPRTSRRTAARERRVVCVLLHYVGAPNVNKDLGALLMDFARRAPEQEPGLLSYVVTLAMGSATTFVVHAQFVDWAAFEAHAETPHMDDLLPRLNALLDAPIGMEIFLGA